MNGWGLVASMALVTLAARYVGLAWRIEVSGTRARFLECVPPAVFAAIVATSLSGSRGSELELSRVAAVLVAAAVARLSRQVWAGIVAGAITFFVLHRATGG